MVNLIYIDVKQNYFHIGAGKIIFWRWVPRGGIVQFRAIL